MFVLYRFDHNKDSAKKSANVFLYYCPDLAKPREKMFYSSTKSMVIRILEELGITVNNKVAVGWVVGTTQCREHWNTRLVLHGLMSACLHFIVWLGGGKRPKGRHRGDVDEGVVPGPSRGR